MTLSNAECRFGYRDSIFKRELKGRAVILAVHSSSRATPQFRLRYGDGATGPKRSAAYRWKISVGRSSLSEQQAARSESAGKRRQLFLKIRSCRKRRPIS